MHGSHCKNIYHDCMWALPNNNLGLIMSQEEFLIALQLHLGIAIFPSSPFLVRCPCGQIIDKFGDQYWVLDLGHFSPNNAVHCVMSSIRLCLLIMLVLTENNVAPVRTVTDLDMFSTPIFYKAKPLTLTFL